jgi:hypothetical protein
LAEYRQQGPEAGVYCIRNTRTGRLLLGSSLNLASMRGKLEFSRSTGTTSALDRRLQPDLREFGLEAFELEVLEVLELRPDATPARLRDDLAALEQLWREKLDSAQLY